MSKRWVLGRFRGANFGLIWSVLSPFMMLGVYAFAVGTVLNSRWLHEVGGDHLYVVILFIGLILHGFFAECLTGAPTLIVTNPNFVKRAVFPLDALPWPMLLSALFHAFMSLVVLAILVLILEHYLSASIPFLSVIFTPLVPLTLSMS